MTELYETRTCCSDLKVVIDISTTYRLVSIGFMREELSHITIVLEIAKSRYETTDDHIFLEAFEVVDLTRSRCIYEDADSLLERCCREP